MENNIDMIAKDLVENNPEVRIIVDQFPQVPPVFADIEYRIMGEDQFILQNLETVRAYIKQSTRCVFDSLSIK